MKKLFSTILAITMICSCFAMPTAANAADITEAERKAILAEKDYQYVDITPNIDVFASASVIRDYANFNTEVNSNDSYNMEYTETNANGEEYTYRNRIPSVTKDGLTPITGEEEYYKKGITNDTLDTVRISPMLFVTESFKMTADELKNVALLKYKGSGASTTAKAVAADTEKYVNEITNFSKAEYNYLPNVVKTEEAGENYYVYLKANEADAQFKIGPINDKKYVKNAFDFIKASSKTIELPAGTTGDKLAIAVAVGDVNNGSGYSGDYALNLAKADAALIPFEIVYASGAKETNYVVVTKMIQTATTVDDLVGVSIYSADKYDANGVEIDYTNTDLYYKGITETSPLTSLSGTEYTLDDIQFPSNIYAAEMNVAISLRARQDTSNNNYSNKATVGIFDLKDEEVSKINVINDQAPGDNTDIEGVIGLNNGNNSYPRALIPVTFKDSANADPNKVYFLYVARVSGYPAILGATVMGGESIQEKIDALNEVLKTLDSETLTMEQIAEYRAQIKAIKELSEYVLDRDFETTALDEAENKYGDQRPLYAPVEMEMLTDLFATSAERRDEVNWINPNSYHAWLGFGSSTNKLPFAERTKITSGCVLTVDHNNTTALQGIAELKKGRYVLEVGGVPYRLGKITEGVLDQNAFAPGEMIMNTESNILEKYMDKKFAMYLSGDETYYTISGGKFDVAIPTEKINVLTTSLNNQKTATNYGLYAVAAKAYLDNGESVDYTLLTGEAFQKEYTDINDAVLFVPKNTETEYNSYAAINGAIGTEVKTLESMEGVKLSKIKLPSAPEVAGTSVSTSNYQGISGEKVTVARKYYYQNVILPEAVQELAVDRGTYVTGAYASSFELVAPKGTKITAVEFMHDSGGTLAYDSKGGATYADAVGAFISSNSTAAYVLVPATVEGVEDYDVYVRIKRNCHHSAILGVTSETTVQDAKAKIEELMESAKTLEDIEAVEEMKEFMDGNTLKESDLAEETREKYNALAESVDVVAEVESVTTDNKAIVNVSVTNHTRLAGKSYMVVVAFYDGKDRLIEAVPHKLATTAERNINETVTVNNVPENTAKTQVYVWKDFLSIISLID